MKKKKVQKIEFQAKKIYMKDRDSYDEMHGIFLPAFLLYANYLRIYRKWELQCIFYNIGMLYH